MHNFESFLIDSHSEWRIFTTIHTSSFYFKADELQGFVFLKEKDDTLKR